MVENDRAKTLWDFQIKTEKLVMVNQLDIVAMDKQRKTVVVIDAAIPSESNIRKKQDE